MLDRRDFLKRSALAGAGLALLAGRPLPLAAASNASIGTLTALGLVDDALHLLGQADGLAPLFRESLAFGINTFEPLPGNVAFFGHLMPADADRLRALLQQARARRADPEARERLKLTLALASGWLVQRAGADIVGGAVPPSDEAALYQDAELLRARSARQPGTASADEVAALLREMAPRTLTRFHTLIPDYDDATGWVLRLQAWRRDHAAHMARYAQAFANPDPAKRQRYVVAPHFYRREDPILQAAEQVRHGGTANVAQALAASQQSLYGKALAQGLVHVQAAAAFFEGELDDAALQQQLARS